MTESSVGDPQAGAIRILLLEDDAALRERFACILEGWPKGDLVAACATLAQVLEALRQQEIDLLTTDLHLPDGHGIEVIRLLGQLYHNADALVLRTGR